MSGSCVVLTGASGGGKSTIAQAIESTQPECTVFRFDTIGVPSAEIMATFGTSDQQPGEAWQRAMTLQWFERIAPILLSGRSVLFEGQMRIAFIDEALKAHSISTARVILVDCDDETRTDRLIHDRQQPDLANENMMSWARYLRNEALNAGYEVLNTGAASVTENVQRVLSYLNRTDR